jgi:hypothetical protein
LAYVNPQGRGRRLCLLFALVALATLLAGAGDARADGRYRAVQCNPTLGSQDHSAATFSASGRLARSVACAERGLGLAAPRRARRGRGGAWMISAPNGTRFSRIDLQSRERAAKGWLPRVSALVSGGSSTPLPGLRADGAWHDAELSGSFDAVNAKLSCAARRHGAGRGRRAARRVCRRSKRSYLYARQFRFTVVDSASPQIGDRSGSLLAGGIRAGGQNLTVTASDRGGGISQIFLRVNGNATAAHDIPCKTTQAGAGTVGETLSPCPNRRTETLNTNASAAPFRPGDNSVQVCARDYSNVAAPGFAANTTCSAAQTVNANGGCDKVASSGGSDASAGTPQAPYASAGRLVSSLAPGQTGCLRGTFSFTQLRITRPGITLTSFPGQRATLRGNVWVAHGGNRVTISHLNLEGGGSPKWGPSVTASDVVFDDDNVTNHHTEICFLLGGGDGRAIRTVIENSRIHDCGRIPSTNQDHGIYVGQATGTVIRNNWIYANTDRGIQLYPDSQLARVYGNVIDGNGQGVLIAGDGGTASSGNFVESNVITNSKLGYNVDSRWPGGKVGAFNLVRNNCVWASNPNSAYNRGGGITSDAPLGFAASGNVIADPRYVSRFFADFTLQPGSPCAFTGA